MGKVAMDDTYPLLEGFNNGLRYAHLRTLLERLTNDTVDDYRPNSTCFAPFLVPCPFSNFPLLIA